MYLSQYSDFIRAQERTQLGLKLRWNQDLSRYQVFGPRGKLISSHTSGEEAQAAYLKACQDYQALRAFGECR